MQLDLFGARIEPTCPRPSCKGAKLRPCCGRCSRHDGCNSSVDHMDACVCGYGDLACRSTTAHHRRVSWRREDAEAVEVRRFAGFYGALAVPCATCGVDVGQTCKRPSGHRGPFVKAHAARAKLAARTILVGLQCATCDARDGIGAYVAPILDTGTDVQREQLARFGLVGLVVCQDCADVFGEWVREKAEIVRKKRAYGAAWVLDELGDFVRDEHENPIPKTGTPPPTPMEMGEAAFEDGLDEDGYEAVDQDGDELDADDPDDGGGDEGGPARGQEPGSAAEVEI